MSNIELAVEKYMALLELEKVSHSRTTRARNELLRSIPDHELPAVALILKQRGALTNHAVHSK